MPYNQDEFAANSHRIVRTKKCISFVLLVLLVAAVLLAVIFRDYLLAKFLEIASPLYTG